MTLFFTHSKAPLKAIYFFAWLFAFHLSAQAQENAYEIQILDELEKTPISDVHVFNTSKSFTVTSNAEGKISIPSNIGVEETLYFQHVAYNESNFTLSQIRKSQNIAQLLPKETELGEIIVSVGRIAEPLSEVTNKVEILKAKEIALTNSQTSADLLQNTGNVYIQKSQMGGGSPVIRGFEANKVLMVLDGVRMNNAIYRGGHLQNAITIDPNVLERTEIVFGPGSVIYGSDALGGVMHFMTKTPTLAKEDEKGHFEGSAMIRVASANDERTAHIDVMYGGKKWGTLSSITRSQFGDLRIGSKRPHGYENWDKRFQYVETNANGADELVANDDSDVLRFTGYDQTDILQKIYFEPSEKLHFNLNLQYSTSSNIPRYDRLNDPDGEGLRFAEWYYGPQNRFLASLSANISRDKGAYDNANIVAAFQRIEEDRINRRFGRTARRYREEDVKVYSLNVDFNKQINERHRLQYGIEATHNDVQSNAYETDVVTDALINEVVSTRYPDGGSSMTTFAAYTRHKWKINDRFILTDGFRYSLVGLQANYIDTSFFSLPYTSTEANSNAFTGSLGLVFKPDLATKIGVTLATGFRSPNIDDATKVFDPNDEIVVVPNVGIRPEYAYNAELGIQRRFNEWLKISVDGYYTHLSNLIKRAPFTLNGQDSLQYDGDFKDVYANINAGKAYIAGFAISAVVDITDRVSMEKKFNFTKGRDLSNDVPLGHIPPAFGQFLIRYKGTEMGSSFFVRYNAWKHIEDYSPGSEDKVEEAVAEGTPSWFTLNYRFHYELSKYLQLTVSVENILDHHYKPFASGVSASGRNLIVGLRSRF